MKDSSLHVGSRRSADSEFQVVGPATAKDRRPVGLIKFRMDNGGGNGVSSFEVEIWADTAMFRNVIVAGFRKCRDLVGDGIRCSSKIKPRLRADGLYSD